jgi:hypothetical protein
MDTRFGKYFIRPDQADLSGLARRPMVRSDDHDLVSFYFDSAWYYRPCVVRKEEYALAYDELICFVGQDMDHPEELGGEVRLFIAGQEFVTDKSCMVLIPQYVPHGPISVTRVSRPFFTYTGGASREWVPVSREQWRVPARIDFDQYVLHNNGIDNNEAELEVFRLHNEENKIIGNVSGVFYGKFRWFRVTTPEDMLFALESHSHSQPEMLNFFGNDSKRPSDLGARVTMEMMGETYSFDQSTSVFVPANQPHCPLTINRVERPFMFFTLMPDCRVYTLD